MTLAWPVFQPEVNIECGGVRLAGERTTVSTFGHFSVSFPVSPTNTLKLWNCYILMLYGVSPNFCLLQIFFLLLALRSLFKFLVPSMDALG